MWLHAIQCRRQQWTPSDTGNWTGYQVDTSGNSDAIETTTGTDWADPAHDARGNATTIPRPNDPANAYTCTYDAWNRLVKVADGATTVAEYRYDGLHRRIARLVPDGQNWDRTDFYYTRSWQVIEQRFANAQADKDAVATAAKYQYVWSLRYIDACICRDEDKDADGNCVDAEGAGGSERLYYASGANMEVTAVVSTSGTVQERYTYTPYGQVTRYNPDWSDEVTWANSKHNEILYSGYRYDGETGLYHVRYRMYHPTLGRWAQRDDAEYPDGLNDFQYAIGDPLGYVDPEGSKPICVVVKDKPEGRADVMAAFLDEGKSPVPRTKAGANIWGMTCCVAEREGKSTRSFKYRKVSERTFVSAVPWKKCPEEVAYIAIHFEVWTPAFKMVIKWWELVPGKEALAFARNPAKLVKAVSAWNAATLKHERTHGRDAQRIFQPILALGFGWDCSRASAVRGAQLAAGVNEIGQEAMLLLRYRQSIDTFHAEDKLNPLILEHEIMSALFGLDEILEKTPEKEETP